MARICSQVPGEWVKGKIIGSGSYGAVHLAMDKTSGALFVVKHAHSGLALQSLENEASLLESLDSPHVVKCLGKNMSKGLKGDDVMCVFMEYMAGGSLSDIADNFGGSLDEGVIRSYTKEILHGLKYLHRNQIVHCDVKCKNVLLSSSGNVKLADFGCARRIENSSECSISVGGTPLWMAPEVLRKERLDFASDIWSLGCTVIEMATGMAPWSNDVSDPVVAVLKIACSDQKPQFPSHFSEEGLDFLTRCLERCPEKRWTAEQLLGHPFICGDSQKRYASSPASVLDFGNYDSDEAESPDQVEYQKCRNPFSARHCDKRMGMFGRILQAENDLFGSSEDWITVRSG